jgi:hypothetical protein
MLRADSAAAVDSLLMDWLARAIPARKCARKRDCGATGVMRSVDSAHSGRVLGFSELYPTEHIFP